ncbi:MAG: hypothetical protein M0R80_10520 [Proteobacteria bacterium]|jgi:hypothetical protein|nr:hypothetical protein [Pseudomonadota bacterium]
MRNRIRIISMALLCCALGACSSASEPAGTAAAPGDMPEGVAPPPGQPPAEAFAACDGKGAGDACEVPLGEGKLTGECAALPGDAGGEKLSCRVQGPPPGRPPGGDAMMPPPGGPGGGRPPEEALAACDGKKTGDACSMKIGDRATEGTCSAPPEGAEGGRLSCRPVAPEGSDGKPPIGDRPAPAAAPKGAPAQ